ncbi:hypothetical protein [Bradyrhizobium sp. STM 3561]|uniref:hypothetical protein n=1 Tax=Bradyrhizobium sp. STM 3561 TaxID=578923 RepID=UPI003890945B
MDIVTPRQTIPRDILSRPDQPSVRGPWMTLTNNRHLIACIELLACDLLDLRSMLLKRARYVLWVGAIGDRAMAPLITPSWHSSACGFGSL